ncbi:MAG: RnfABCDGE type electron transport complex subunit D [Treponema sp.]|nr:RnfABCDGE type electron transport complex subunit D [Treponema sp.]
MAENSKALFEKLQSQKPQVNLARPTVGRMWLVSLCAFMVVIQSSLTDSFSSFFIALAAVSAAVLTELLILYPSGRAVQLKNGSAVASALVLALLLPDRIPPVYAALGAVFAMAVVKHSFGGLGSNWLNPAAGGWLFIRAAWPGVFNQALEGSPLSLLAGSLSKGANPQGSPMGILKIDSAGLFSQASGTDSLVRSFLNDTVFAVTGAELPGGYIDLFAAGFQGIIADRGILALVAGTIIITASQANRSWIPAIWLGVYGFLVRLAGALPYGGGWWNGDVLFSFCSGGVLITAFILAADPATGAKSSRGILAASAAGAVLAWLFRYYGAEPYGAMFSVILVNALLPVVRLFETHCFYEKQEPPAKRDAVRRAS